MKNFQDLGLSPSTLESLQQLGFETPTPVQEQAIPLLLEPEPTDFIGLAQTGTGKTAAFGLPLLERIDDRLTTTQALIMAPTRELGQQTAQQLVKFAANRNYVNVEVVYGGAAITNQIKALRKPTQILVATPGRLLDLLQRRAVSLDAVQYVVLDEADELLNMGFKEDIDRILDHTPNERVTWLFSATMPAGVRRIVTNYMKEPVEVAVNRQEVSNTDIVHQYVMTKTAHKLAALRRFLDLQPEMRGILFCRTKRETKQIADDLGDLGYSVESLHGDLSQPQRDAAMKRFKARSMQLLIATDVAARGIDVDGLTHVMHHSLPDQLESYTHRSGRTGRAGKKGISLAFINPREGRRITEIERKLKVTFERIEVPTVDSLRSSRMNRWANLIIGTKVDRQAEEMLPQLQDRFAHLSKEDILKRWITTQLDHLTLQHGEVADLNETTGGTGAKKSSGANYHRYYINIGTMDGVTRGDLLHFISDVGKLDRKYFGAIKLQRNCAFFEVDGSRDGGLSDRFKGMTTDGRSIRVNRDDLGPKRAGGKGSGGKSGGKGKQKKKNKRNFKS